MKSFDVLGNIAVVKFSEKTKSSEKKKIAEKILKENKSIRTILEKKEKIKGRLRKFSTAFILGEKTKEVLYKENNCLFRFNIEETYFSPRLSNERKEIASLIKKNETVLVMFAGVAPFSIVIAKNSKAKKVYSNELNREANKYAELNISLNKLKNKIELIPGDIKRVAPKIKQKFDVIVMPRPQLKDSFLESAFLLVKKGTRIYYYDFCRDDEIEEVKEKIWAEAKRAKKSIKILNVKKAGELAPHKIRLRIDFKII
ncbi:tRNA (guanine(37)-N1)-methyltransferase Trm5a [uncultured archaeon]|nr:tRNA (guanine(37)-N1)-methyltransferase Trm5a [uncultured archaeon]